MPGAAQPPCCRPESWAVGRSGKGLPRAVAHPQPTQLAVSTAVPRRAARPLQCDALPRARGWRRVGAPARPHHAWNLSAPSLSAPGWGVTRATRQVARGRGAGPGAPGRSLCRAVCETSACRVRDTARPVEQPLAPRPPRPRPLQGGGVGGLDTTPATSLRPRRRLNKAGSRVWPGLSPAGPLCADHIFLGDPRPRLRHLQCRSLTWKHVYF